MVRNVIDFLADQSKPVKATLLLTASDWFKDGWHYVNSPLSAKRGMLGVWG